MASKITGRSFKKASAAEIVAIHELLQRHGRMVDGAYVYDDGWSDGELIKHVNAGLSPDVAARVRRETFGNIANSNGHQASVGEELAQQDDATPSLWLQEPQPQAPVQELQAPPASPAPPAQKSDSQLLFEAIEAIRSSMARQEELMAQVLRWRQEVMFDISNIKRTLQTGQ